MCLPSPIDAGLLYRTQQIRPTVFRLSAALIRHERVDFFDKAGWIARTDQNRLRGYPDDLKVKEAAANRSDGSLLTKQPAGPGARCFGKTP